MIKDTIKWLKRVGTEEQRTFIEQRLERSTEEYLKIIAENTKALYSKGMSPAEIKGFYEVCAVMSMYVNPKVQQ